MASINTIVKRKQYLWLGIVVVGAASAIGGALYLSDVDMSGNGEAVAEQEPVAAGNNGPDGSVCFMEGQHHAGEITG